MENNCSNNNSNEINAPTSKKLHKLQLNFSRFSSSWVCATRRRSLSVCPSVHPLLALQNQLVSTAAPTFYHCALYAAHCTRELFLVSVSVLVPLAAAVAIVILLTMLLLFILFFIIVVVMMMMMMLLIVVFLMALPL